MKGGTQVRLNKRDEYFVYIFILKVCASRWSQSSETVYPMAWDIKNAEVILKNEYIMRKVK